MIELVEKIMLDIRPKPWVVLSIGGCGILTEATVWRDDYGGGHDVDYQGARMFALAFAHRVVCSIGLSPAYGRTPTPQILIDAADGLNDGSTHVALICTTWQCLPEGVEICSVGTNSVLVFEGETIRQVIAPHTVYELLKSQGEPLPSTHLSTAHIALKAVGSKKDPRNSTTEDVRVARVPLLPTTTIAVIANWHLAEEIMQRAVPREALSSFIESWDGLAKRARTSVLLSL